MDLPYAERRARLRDLDLNGLSWQTPPHEEGDGEHDDRGQQALRARRRSSPSASTRRYEPGRRSRAWLKLKNHMGQEFVVGGWQPGEKGRTGSIGSLLVGYYDGDVLHYAGKVGSGLSGPVIAELEQRFASRGARRQPVRRRARPEGRAVRRARRSSSRSASRSGRRRATSAIPPSSGCAPTRTRARWYAKCPDSTGLQPKHSMDGGFE